MNLNWNHIIGLILLIINLSCFVLCKESVEEKGRKLSKKYSEPVKKLVRHGRDVQSTESMGEIEKLCKKFCESRQNKECKMAVKFKRYDVDKKICTCVDTDGLTKDSKIYKAETPHSKYDQNNLKTVLLSKVSMPCNKSDEISYESCQLYCKRFKNSDDFDCSLDESQCHCYGRVKATKSSQRRMKRQMIAETVLDDGTQVVGMSITPPYPARRPHQLFGGHHHHHRPPPMPYPGCNQYTCMNQCPYGCDSLCRANVECYCSCPEDLTYEYYDDHSLFGSLFG